MKQKKFNLKQGWQIFLRKYAKKSKNYYLPKNAKILLNFMKKQNDLANIHISIENGLITKIALQSTYTEIFKALKF